MLPSPPLCALYTGALDVLQANPTAGGNAVLQGMTLSGSRPGTSSRPGTRENNFVGGNTSRPRTRDREDEPIVHRDKMTDLKPGVTYGGGFQIFSPNKPERPELRSLDQTTSLPELEFAEQKRMIEGDDGKFYVGDKGADLRAEDVEVDVGDKEEEGGEGDGGGGNNQ